MPIRKASSNQPHKFKLKTSLGSILLHNKFQYKILKKLLKKNQSNYTILCLTLSVDLFLTWGVFTELTRCRTSKLWCSNKCSSKWWCSKWWWWISSSSTKLVQTHRWPEWELTCNSHMVEWWLLLSSSSPQVSTWLVCKVGTNFISSQVHNLNSNMDSRPSPNSSNNISSLSRQLNTSLKCRQITWPQAMEAAAMVHPLICLVESIPDDSK